MVMRLRTQAVLREGLPFMHVKTGLRADVAGFQC